MYHLLLLIGSISTVLASDEMQLNAFGGRGLPDFLVLIPANATLGDLKKEMQKSTSEHRRRKMVISHDGKWFEDGDDETPLSQLGICDTSDIRYYCTRHLLEEGAGTLTLFASTQGGEEFPVIILADATLSDLKKEIKRVTNKHDANFFRIRLNIDISFGGKRLDKKSDATPVADLGIGPEAKIEYTRVPMQLNAVGGFDLPDFTIRIPADATLGDLKKKMQDITSKHSDIFVISYETDDGKWFEDGKCVKWLEDGDDETPLSQLGICDTSDIRYYCKRHLLKGPGKLELFASTPGGEEFPVIILADATLSHLKEEIKRMTNKHYENYYGIALNIEISFAGEPLDEESDATAVADLGIGPGAKIGYKRVEIGLGR